MSKDHGKHVMSTTKKKHNRYMLNHPQTCYFYLMNVCELMKIFLFARIHTHA